MGLLSSENGAVVREDNMTNGELSVLCNKVSGIGELVPQRQLETRVWKLDAACAQNFSRVSEERWSPKGRCEEES